MQIMTAGCQYVLLDAGHRGSFPRVRSIRIPVRKHTFHGQLSKT